MQKSRNTIAKGSADLKNNIDMPFLRGATDKKKNKDIPLDKGCSH
jgi:hypothetical protein